MIYRFKLPFPLTSQHSQNARGHWAVRAKKVKKAREESFFLCKGQGAKLLECSHVDVHITFYPPDRRKRDDDNVRAAFKSYRDGVADAIGVDDGNWNVTYSFSKERLGCVVVEIQESKDE